VSPDAPPRWAPPLTLGLALAGAAVAAYLTAEHYTSALTLACPNTGTVNCAKVTTSAQAVFLGVPVAVLGLLWFLVLLPLMTGRVWRSPRRGLVRLRVVGTALGIPAVLYLVYAELFEVRAVCLWCTAVHALAVLLFAAVVLAEALRPVADPQVTDQRRHV
jgi:uncharacterized membrane protein